ncbi:hypothetical protein CsatB_014067 [Cannabis sativa]
MRKLKETIGDVENLAFVSDRHQSIVRALDIVFPDAHHEFHREFENIRAMNPAVAKYLEEIGFEKWVRSYFPGVRYNVMTSNWAESFNNTTKDARGFPITAAVAFLRSKVQKWFASQERSISVYTLCSPYYTTEYWRRTYEGTIMPVGDEDDWELPDDIKNMTVGVPVEKQPVGRPKKQKVGRIKNNRTACNGERIIKSRKCSKCGAKGHNRSTCTYRGLT